MSARRTTIAAIAVVCGVAALALVTSLPQLRNATRQAAAAPTPPVPAATPEITPGGFSARIFTDGRVVYRYQAFVPRDYDPTKRFPVIIAFHGSAEKGSDGVQQVGVGLGPYVRAHAATFPAIVVFPQLPKVERVYQYVPAMMRLIDAAVRQLHADTTRVYLTGLSLGGMVAYDIARRSPGRYAALVPIAAPMFLFDLSRDVRLPDDEAISLLVRSVHPTPVWIFQGATDPIVPATKVRRMVAAFEAAGTRVTYTEYAGGAHQIWDQAYRTPELWSWLLAQRR